MSQKYNYSVTRLDGFHETPRRAIRMTSGPYNGQPGWVIADADEESSDAVVVYFSHTSQRIVTVPEHFAAREQVKKSA